MIYLKTVRFLKSQILSLQICPNVRISLRAEYLQIFDDVFIPLGLNDIPNTRTATNHLLDIPQKQTTHHGTYSLTSTASSA